MIPPKVPPYLGALIRSSSGPQPCWVSIWCDCTEELRGKTQPFVSSHILEGFFMEVPFQFLMRGHTHQGDFRMIYTERAVGDVWFSHVRRRWSDSVRAVSAAPRLSHRASPSPVIPSHRIGSSLPCLRLLPVGLSLFPSVLPKDVLVSSIGMEAWTFKNIFTIRGKTPIWDVAVLIRNPHPWIDLINQTKRLQSFFLCFYLYQHRQ